MYDSSKRDSSIAIDSCACERTSGGKLSQPRTTSMKRSGSSIIVANGLTTKLTDRHDLTYESQKLQGKSPGANGGSVQRLVELSRFAAGQ